MNNLSLKSVLYSLQFGDVSLNARAVGFIAAMLVVAGCASAPVRPAVEVVKERSQARWDAMVKGDFKAGYQFTSPAGKSVYTEQQYEASYRRGFWTAAEADKVECETAEVCVVDVWITYRYNGVPMRTPVQEKWIKQGSDWWFVLER